MFDWVLNRLWILAITIFFPDVSKFQVNTFSIFFSTINFSYQYLPEAKAYLEPSRTFYNGAFSRNIIFLQNWQENTSAGVSF